MSELLSVPQEFVSDNPLDARTGSPIVSMARLLRCLECVEGEAAHALWSQMWAPPEWTPTLRDRIQRRSVFLLYCDTLASTTGLHFRDDAFTPGFCSLILLCIGETPVRALLNRVADSAELSALLTQQFANLIAGRCLNMEHTRVQHSLMEAFSRLQPSVLWAATLARHFADSRSLAVRREAERILLPYLQQALTPHSVGAKSVSANENDEAENRRRLRASLVQAFCAINTQSPRIAEIVRQLRVQEDAAETFNVQDPAAFLAGQSVQWCLTLIADRSNLPTPGQRTFSLPSSAFAVPGVAEMMNPLRGNAHFAAYVRSIDSCARHGRSEILSQLETILWSWVPNLAVTRGALRLGVTASIPMCPTMEAIGYALVGVHRAALQFFPMQSSSFALSKTWSSLLCVVDSVGFVLSKPYVSLAVAQPVNLEVVEDRQGKHFTTLNMDLVVGTFYVACEHTANHLRSPDNRLLPDEAATILQGCGAMVEAIGEVTDSSATSHALRRKVLDWVHQLFVLMVAEPLNAAERLYAQRWKDQPAGLVAQQLADLLEFVRLRDFTTMPHVKNQPRVASSPISSQIWQLWLSLAVATLRLHGDLSYSTYLSLVTNPNALEGWVARCRFENPENSDGDATERASIGECIACLEQHRPSPTKFVDVLEDVEVLHGFVALVATLGFRGKGRFQMLWNMLWVVYDIGGEWTEEVFGEGGVPDLSDFPRFPEESILQQTALKGLIVLLRLARHAKPGLPGKKSRHDPRTAEFPFLDSYAGERLLEVCGTLVT